MRSVRGDRMVSKSELPAARPLLRRRFRSAVLSSSRLTLRFPIGIMMHMGIPIVRPEDRVKFVPYRGKKLLVLDFSNYSLEDAKALIVAARKVIDDQPPGSLLIFCDFTNTPATPDVVFMMRDFAKNNRPFVKASAAIGLDGPRALILNTINRFVQRSVMIFSDAVKAKNWLVSQ